MARQFSYPEVAALEVGQSCVVAARASEVRRKVALYAARNNKSFLVHSPEKGYSPATVERLFLGDGELPGAA